MNFKALKSTLAILVLSLITAPSFADKHTEEASKTTNKKEETDAEKARKIAAQKDFDKIKGEWIFRGYNCSTDKADIPYFQNLTNKYLLEKGLNMKSMYYVDPSTKKFMLRRDSLQTVATNANRGIYTFLNPTKSCSFEEEWTLEYIDVGIFKFNDGVMKCKETCSAETCKAMKHQFFEYTLTTEEYLKKVPEIDASSSYIISKLDDMGGHTLAEILTETDENSTEKRMEFVPVQTELKPNTKCVDLKTQQERGYLYGKFVPDTNN